MSRHNAHRQLKSVGRSMATSKSTSQRWRPIGVRRAVSLAIPAYMASAASTRQLQDLILADSCANEDSYLANIETSWTATTGLPSPQPPSSTKHRSWD